MNEDIIKKVKSATVAIGVGEKKTNNMTLLGSGFLISEKGHVASAKHVFKDSVDLRDSLNKDGLDAKLIAVHVDPSSAGYQLSALYFSEITQDWIFPYTIDEKNDKKFGVPKEFDTGVIKLNLQKPLPCLKIKDSGKLEISQKIALSGYPRISKSFVFSKDSYQGVRVSPLMQFGHIAGLLQTDATPEPYALQTDIVSMGGASGSPIVDQENGEVIAITQKILPSYAEGKVEGKLNPNQNFSFKVPGYAHIGLVWGDSFHRIQFLQELVQKDPKEYDNKEITGGRLTYNISKLLDS